MGRRTVRSSDDDRRGACTARGSVFVAAINEQEAGREFIDTDESGVAVDDTIAAC